MKRLWWIIRIAVIIAAAYCIFAPGGSHTLQNAQAQRMAGCDTSTLCVKNTSENCYCPNVVIGGEGCNGCYIRSGTAGCGNCSAGP